MASAEDTSPPPAGWAGLGETAPRPGAPRRRLFRKYALIFIALVGAALLINSGFDFWFSYQENKSALVRVQQEKAESAAQRIAEFVEEIKSQIGWTTHAQWDAGPVDQRKQDYVRLQRQVPAITELQQLDNEGKERLKVSRLAMDVIDSGTDFSQSPAFTEAKARRVWFSPVYFRKESEPYMTIAMARDGRNAGVTVAEINLKLLFDVVTALKIGQGGYAYVVDQRGRLIAHPDISLVLRDTDLSKLPQVAGALNPQPGGAGVTVADNVVGRPVLTAHAAIPQLGWRVFVEVPLTEAFAPLYGAALRTLVLLALGLIAATLVALVIARRMTGPIHAIAEGAERIGAGELGRRIDIHTGDELEGLAQQFNRMAADLQKSYAELEQRVADRTAQLSEALDQQTATAEVLGIISSSPGQLQPVFEAVLANAVRICGGRFGLLALRERDGFRGAAAHGVGADVFPLSRLHNPPPGTGLAALQATKRTTQVADCATDPSYDPVRAASPAFAGMRTALHVAMLKEGELIGAIIIYRGEILPFGDKEVELVENFAKQAVIAIENVRLITETREALEQQTATAEVLGVINSSPGELAPVFDAMLEKALSLCGAAFGELRTYDGERFHSAAIRGVPPAFAEFRRHNAAAAGPGSLGARVLAGQPIVHVHDLKEEDTYRLGDVNRRGLVDLGGARTALIASLRKDDRVLGFIIIYRQEVLPFSDKQIALLQNFAAQAVIAMENARLITETREALEQQTATAEVLGVINSSPGDLAPVFDAMLEKARRLCEATYGHLASYDGDRFHTAAIHGVPAPFAEFRRQNPQIYGPATPVGRLLQGERIVQVIDCADTEGYRDGDPNLRAVVDLGGARTMLVVPLLKDDAIKGFITVYRQEVRPFTDKQIVLLQNFAAQAVIAMENARLITETREALEQQTATAEVLGVINSSPGDLAPVFDAILEKAHSLCGATFGGLFTYDGELLWPAAEHNMPPAFSAMLQKGFPADPVSRFGRVVSGEPFVHIHDLAEISPGAPPVEIGGIRTQLVIPLRKDDTLLGVITANRREVRPFSDKQIALLQNFAAQAVIAMENARLITETREALAQQTATAEVLGVINSSPGDLAPVFDAMLERAMRLCGAAFGELHTFHGDRFEPVAMLGVPPALTEYRTRNPPRLVSGTVPGRIAAGMDLVEISDLMAEEPYRTGEPMRRAVVDLGGARSAIAVALRHNKDLRGIIFLYRQEVRPFSDKQIALLQNFAAQAVIAMENARLITETRERTRDLQESLRYQTATSDVLKVISQSVFDLDTVLQTVVATAVRLCRADQATIYRLQEGEYRWAAGHSLSPEYERIEREVRIAPGTGTLVGRVAMTRDTVHILDAWTDPLYEAKDDARIGGVHTMLGVPLLRDGAPIGAIGLARRRVEAYTGKEIALVTTFADQAVIAIENARLITETRDALEQQTATAEVLGVINASPGDLAPVFDAMLDKALSLCGAAFGVLWTYDGNAMSAAASRNAPPAYAEFLASGPQRPGEVTAHGRLIRGSRVEHIPDVAASEDYRRGDPFPRALVDLGGGHTILAVPLRRDDVFLGDIFIYRQEVRPFTDKQIALLQNFAAQAVIAMENARLITETREALEQQTATAEVLGVINSSPGDLTPVFDAILEKAHDLCGAAHGHLTIYDGEHFRSAATHGVPEGFAELLRHPFRPGLDVANRLFAGDEVIHIPDMAALTYAPDDRVGRAAVEIAGIRTLLIIALRKDKSLLGYITAHRTEVRPFSEKQIALLQNFAAQAVIAMENARLLGELRERTADIQESLEYQTATSDVLKVISRSDAELGPVLENLVETATRLCQAEHGFVFRRRGDRHHLVASFGLDREFREFMSANPFVPDHGTLSGRVALEGRIVHLDDAASDPEYTWTEAQQRGNLRTGLGVPLLRDGTLLGIIVLYRSRVERFTDKQIALAGTFADQAVIAMENARLLGELRERTADIQESLEYQTATSDVLKVISQSVFDLEPVLHTVVSTAIRLCQADHAAIFRNIDGEFVWAAGEGLPPQYERVERALRIRPGNGTVIGRAALEGRTVQVLDAWNDSSYELADGARAGGVRTLIGVPLMRDGLAIGAIGLARQRVEAFTPKQIELVTTFADQAVIAIENARLLGELRERTDELGRSVEELKALAEVGQAVSSTLDLGAVLSTILNRSVGLTGADAGVIFRYSQGRHAFRLVEAVGWDAGLIGQVRAMRIDENMTLMGEAVTHRSPTQIADLRERPSNALRDATLAAGYRSVLIVPLVGADQIFGALLLQRQRPGEFPEATLRLMQTLAAQSVLAIQNARLFREIAEKSEQLALASQHKSQFLANMSHELRTPLNAILGYAELLVDGIYGEVPQKAMAVLERVQNNGKHLLALINDVLDLSKIEAGQLVLTFEDYALPDVVQSVVTATEALASTKGLKMSATVQPGLPTGHGDARRLSQVLLNLVGNALKFTDQGEVAIGAVAEDGHFVLTVRDTGPGIAPEDQHKIFGEFQQVDNSNTRKKGGTGLGLAISKRMVELQGGSIGVESELGQGATFRVTLPIRVEHAADELAGELAGEMMGAA